jgi:non-canonical purine NTP pyrophosphatase (RdgB/HAM1 family)
LTAPYRYSDLTFVSGNQSKLAEYRAILGISDLAWSQRESDESDERQDVNIATLALEKLRRTRPKVRAPFFVEHSGLVVDAWQNLPGGLTRLFLENVGNAGICRMMSDYAASERVVTAVAVIGLQWPDGRERMFEGRKRGVIAYEPTGTTNFGWDPIFIPDEQPPGQQLTYAEMSREDKNRISMRRAAADLLRDEIRRSFTL